MGNLDSLTDEELNALVAKKVMGWNLGGMMMLRIETGLPPWAPTAKGREDQAMMVADKMFQDGWGWELSSPVPGDTEGPGSDYTMVFWKPPTNLVTDDIEIFADAPTLGRAIVLAALTAVEGEASHE